MEVQTPLTLSGATLQLLDVVKLREFAAVFGRDDLLEFFQGLLAEDAAVVPARLIFEFTHESAENSRNWKKSEVKIKN
jgi:hypothetical protein